MCISVLGIVLCVANPKKYKKRCPKIYKPVCGVDGKIDLKSITSFYIIYIKAKPMGILVLQVKLQ